MSSRTQVAPGAAGSSAETRLERRHLLTDEQVVRFIIDGYTLVQTELSDAFHASVCRRIDEVFAELGHNPGNEIFDRVPDLHAVYADPMVRGAMASILGADYTMSAHRHCHYRKPGSPGGHWHQDSVNVRHHQIHTILGMYYPQDVTEELGPTVVLPGTQYHNTPSTLMASYVNFRSQVPLTVTRGTVAITHYDIWHAWMPNKSTENRRMLKFLFNRASEPEEPSWNHDSDYTFNPNPFSLPIDGQSEAYKHRRLWRSVWDWMRGKPGEGGDW